MLSALHTLFEVFPDLDELSPKRGKRKENKKTKDEGWIFLLQPLSEKNELLTDFYYLFFTNHSSHDWFMPQSSGGHRFSKIGNVLIFLFPLSLWDSLYDTYIKKGKEQSRKKHMTQVNCVF